MRLILISGQSGSGKSVALRFLEDLGFFCVDNLPLSLLDELLKLHDATGDHKLAVSVDTRSEHDFEVLPVKIRELRDSGIRVDCLFLESNISVLVQRFSETRRRHPLVTEGITLEEAIASEIEVLAPLRDSAYRIDTSALPVPTLRQFIKSWLDIDFAPVQLVFQSFGFKYGVPLDSDFIFDVRCLPNPYYDPVLRPFSGLDEPIKAFFSDKAVVWQMIDQIEAYLRFCLPLFQAENRYYLTVAIGCTGGQHRSVFIAQNLAERFNELHPQIRHRQLVY